jgi:hypothetical protein
MRMKRFSVTFEASMDIVVYAPEDTDVSTVRELAEDIAADSKYGGWEFPDFEARIVSASTVDVPAEERQVRVDRGWSNPTSKRFLAESAMMLSDSGEEIVLPSDAKWWVATPEQDEEEKARAFLRSEINHPDQKALFPAMGIAE